MTSRVYQKNDLLYSTDGAGLLCDTHTKVVTLLAAVAAGGNIAIQLLDPNGRTKVQTFIAQVLTATGALYVSDAANLTTYVLANNVLTISVPGQGAGIPLNAQVTIIYTVGL